MSISKSTSAASSPSSETVSNDIVFYDANVDYCASHFHSYSKDNLRRLNKQTLHSIVLSPFLAIESEDDLLGVLIELGPSSFEFWRYIEVIFLTDKGL
jgi:hypothetical protein